MKKWGGIFGLNRFHHMRKVSGPEDPLQKPNADTLYSLSVIDLSAGAGSDKKLSYFITIFLSFHLF